MIWEGANSQRRLVANLQLDEFTGYQNILVSKDLKMRIFAVKCDNSL